MSSPDAEPIFDLIEAFRRSKTLFTAVSMGLFDRLARGPADARTLAGGGRGEAVERLLDACVSLSLIEKTPTGYRNTELASRYLVGDSPDTLAGYILYSDRGLYPLWGNLEDGVREGANHWRQTFGFDGELFSSFFKTEEAQ
ncbi:MAG: homocysteine methyltransferase, partial [bacterium]|nr:homocysteine methyltransferase [bacterium]